MALVDLKEVNPCSRLPNAAFRDAKGVRMDVVSKQQHSQDLCQDAWSDCLNDPFKAYLLHA